MENAQIRAASTLILVRDPGGLPKILLGQRAPDAAFMPGAWVFPGGAVDAADHLAVPDAPLAVLTARLLGSVPPAVAALRELREETGLTLGHGLDLSPLTYVFRAVTPPGYARRFDARFFAADARFLSGDPDHFAPEHPELSDLQWVAITEMRRFTLASITRHVLSLVVRRLPSLEQPASVPEVGL